MSRSMSNGKLKCPFQLVYLRTLQTLLDEMNSIQIIYELLLIHQQL